MIYQTFPALYSSLWANSRNKIILGSVIKTLVGRITWTDQAGEISKQPRQ